MRKPVDMTSVTMTLRDVEPVKGFIAGVIDIRNKLKAVEGAAVPDCCKAFAKVISGDMDAAFIELYGGMGTPNLVSVENSRNLGWRFAKSEVEHPERKTWPSVCIVIPVFNSPGLLEKCLVSLMRTEYPGKLFWMCVDNASTDARTLEILASREFTPLRFEEPQGFSTAVNAGIRTCAGFDYYVLFNQDCVVTDDGWLTALINWMEVRPQCAVAGAKLLYPNGKLQHAGILMPAGSCGRHRYINSEPELPEANYYEKVPSVTGAVMAIRASTLDEIGYLDESYKLGCEDTEFCLRAAAFGKEVWYVPDSVVMHLDNAVRKENRQDSERIRTWASVSDWRFREQWGDFVDACASGEVAFVLPDFNPVAGGCRVVAALANTFINAGMASTVYVLTGGKNPVDVDFPMLFDIRHISSLDSADVLVATRFDTVEKTRHILARKRFYLVQQIETMMAQYCGATEDDVLRSYQRGEYDIITIGEHLAGKLAEFGRTSTVLDVGFYRNLYPLREDRWLGGHPFRVLMYATPADYKGGQDSEMVAKSLREKLGDTIEIVSFHRDFRKPAWSDRHYRPQSTSEVAEIYASADCYVYASLSDGFAMTPIESMACGTPVILTDFPGKDQYAKNGENCLVVPFRDFGAIGEAALRLMCDPELWEKLSKNGAATAGNYDWSRVGRQYLRAVLGAPV
jgi:GT2 family glycosyltransferase